MPGPPYGLDEKPKISVTYINFCSDGKTIVKLHAKGRVLNARRITIVERRYNLPSVVICAQ